MPGISTFISDKNLLGPWFTGPSWDAWRVTMKGAFGEPMSTTEQDRFRELAERDPPLTRVRELWCAIGRRAGKDSMASAIACHAAVFGQFQAHLRPGERATILCLAVDRQQARIIFGYIRAYFELVPLLVPLVARVTDTAIELNNGVDVVVATNSFRAIRGRTVALAVLDELSFWRDESGRYVSPDTEVYAALVPALSTLRQAGAMIVGISTVYRRSGLLFDKWRQHHGQPGDVLVIRAPSTTYNPLLDTADIEADIARDPERGAAEWLSEWRSDLADFVDRAVVEAAVVPGLYEIPYRQAYQYTAFCDAAGGSGQDSYTLCIAHAETAEHGGTEKVFVDCLREFRPPFSPAAVTKEMAETILSYGCTQVVGDRYGGEFPRELFAKNGLNYVPAEKSKSDLYREMLPLLNSGAVELLDNQRLIAQLCGLERRTSRGTGKDSIDHGPGSQSHDDLSNACAGAVVHASGVNSDLSIWIRLAS